MAKRLRAVDDNVAMRQLLSEMSAREIGEMENLVDYLHEKAVTPGARLGRGEDSFANMVNQASPLVKNAMVTLYKTLDEPGKPFARLDFQRTCDALGLDEHVVRGVHSVIRNDEICGGLQKRMKTDLDRADLRDAAISKREQTEAALEAHEPLREVQGRVGEFVTDSAEGLTLRETLETLIDVGGDHAER